MNANAMYFGLFTNGFLQEHKANVTEGFPPVKMSWTGIPARPFKRDLLPFNRNKQDNKYTPVGKYLRRVFSGP